eukprot:scaffold4267_cov124-Isochrysis_galbana.AAC.5
MLVRFLNPYVFSWRTKDRMLLCLKYVGKISRANESGSEMTKESPRAVQVIHLSVAVAETI